VLFVPVLTLAVLIGVGFVGYKWMRTGGISFYLIYHQTPDGWRQMPRPEGALPDNLRVSSRGTVWLDTWAGVSRWDGAAWQYYNETAAKDETGPTYGGLALDDEDLWALKGKGVLHWDGARWKRYSEPLTDGGAAIVAGGGQVWIVDLKGNFSHFRDGKWVSHALNLPGVTRKDDEAGYPALARTEDGVVWLVWQGIWRLDGAKWTPLTDKGVGLSDAELVGTVANRLWVSDSIGLRYVSKDREGWTASPPLSTGLAAPVAFHDLTSAGGRTWFATSRGLMEFDGAAWRPVAIPGVEVRGIMRVTAGPNGDLWIIGTPPVSSAKRALRNMVGLSLLLPLAILFVIFWISRRISHRSLEQHRRVTEAVQHATGEVSEELEHGERRLARSSSWSEHVLTAALYIGAIAAYIGLKKVWPQAALWPIPVILIILHLANIFRDSLMERKAKESDPIGPGGPSRYNWGKTWKSVAGAAVLIVIFNLDRLPALRFLGGNIFWLLLLVLFGYKGLMSSLVNSALRRADYDSALKLIRWFHFYNPSGLEPGEMSGHVMLLAGRYRDAERALRSAMASSHAGEHYGFALEHLGSVLMEQGRYDEATRSCEAAMHAFTWMRRPYRGMAEIQLRQGKNPKLALEYVENLIDLTGLSWRERKLNGNPHDDYWGLKAWALARIGQSSEVAPAIEKALAATNKQSLPDLATTNYYAGMAMQALGVQSAANEYFSRAAELDPKGRRGVLAGFAVHESSVLGRVRA